MPGGVVDILLMLVAPLSSLAVYLLIVPASQAVALAAGVVLMLAIARRPAGAP